jgi:hypothetical protein
MSFLEAWQCLNVISISARNFFPAYKLYGRLILNVDPIKFPAYYQILLSNLGEVICKAESSKIRKSSILLFDKIRKRGNLGCLRVYISQIVERMRNGENEIIRQRGLFLSRSLDESETNNFIQIQLERHRHGVKIEKIFYRFLSIIHHK